MNAEEDAVTSSRLGLGGGRRVHLSRVDRRRRSLGGPYGLTMLGQKNMQEDKALGRLSLLRIAVMSIGIELGRKVPREKLHGRGLWERSADVRAGGEADGRSPCSCRSSAEGPARSSSAHLTKAGVGVRRLRAIVCLPSRL